MLQILFFACLVAQSPDAFVRLLHISLNVPAVERQLMRQLLRIQLNFGIAIVHLELQQAVDLAHRMANISNGKLQLCPSVADLAILAWVPRDAFFSLVDDFPFTMLNEDDEVTSIEQRQHAVHEPMDAFCSLILLHSLLRLRIVDVPAWLRNVCHLVKLTHDKIACRLSQSHSLYPRRELLVFWSFHFAVNPYMSDELAMKRLELFSTQFHHIPGFQKSHKLCACSAA